MALSLWNAAPYLTALGRSLAGASGVPLDRGGGDPRDREPLWARALCWTISGVGCGMRRRWASDRHIAEARLRFAAYVGDPDAAREQADLIMSRSSATN